MKKRVIKKIAAGILSLGLIFSELSAPFIGQDTVQAADVDLIEDDTETEVSVDLPASDASEEDVTSGSDISTGETVEDDEPDPEVPEGEMDTALEDRPTGWAKWTNEVRSNADTMNINDIKVYMSPDGVSKSGSVDKKSDPSESGQKFKIMIVSRGGKNYNHTIDATTWRTILEAKVYYSNGDAWTSTKNTFEDYKNYITEIVFRNIDAITADEAFFEWGILKKVIFDDDCGGASKTAGSNAKTSVWSASMFGRCPMLESVLYSDSLTEIPVGTFMFCESLKNVYNADGTNAPYTNTAYTSHKNTVLTAIRSGAFLGCGQLSNLDVPNTLSTIDEMAFQECFSLTTIDLTSVTDLGESAFKKSGITKVELSASIQGVKSYAFQECKSLKSVSLGGSTAVQRQAFEDCSSLSTLSLGNVTYVDYAAFKNCTGLTSLNLSKVEKVEEEGFYGCSGLTSVNLSSCTTVNKKAFYGCSGLSTLNLSSVQEIEESAFGKIGANTITFPLSITKVGLGAFTEGQLLTINYPGTSTEWQKKDWGKNIETQKKYFGNAKVICAGDGVTIDPTKPTPTPTATSTPTPTTKPDKPTPTPTGPAKPTPTPKPNATPTPVPEEPNAVYYNVNFYNNGTKLHTEKVIEGGIVTFIPVAERANCDFIGWFDKTAKLMWSPSAPVYSNIDVTAKFQNRTTGEIEPKDPGDDDEGDDSYDDIPEATTPRDIYLVKGQKICLLGAMAQSTDNKIVSASKFTKGYTTITAKKPGMVKLSVTNSKNETITHMVCVEKPVLSQKSYKLVTGESAPIGVTIGAWTSNYRVFYSSSNIDVAYVDNGRIYAIGKGSAVISAHINGKTYKASVKVTYPKAPAVFGESITMTALQKATIKIDGFKAKTALWTVSDPKVVMIDKNKITAIGCGTAEVTGQDANGAKKTFKVTVKPPTPSIIHLNVGKNKKIAFFNVKNKNALWTTSNPNIVSVDGGKVKAIAPGISEIKAEYNGFIFRAYVVVENPTLNIGDKLVVKGSDYALTLTNGTDYIITSSTIFQPLTFTTKKPQIARANKYGKIITSSAGKTKMTAVINGKKVNVVVNVFDVSNSGDTPKTAAEIAEYATSDAAFEYIEDKDYSEELTISE